MGQNLIQPPTSTQPNTTGASFFRLPGALRTMIYEYALFSWPADPISCRSKQERVTSTSSYAMRDTPGNLASSIPQQASPADRPLALLPSRIALALTCRQAYFEAARIFYEDNYFCVWSGAIFDAWMNSVPKVHVEVIEQLTVKKAAFHRPGSQWFKCHRVSGPLVAQTNSRLHWVYDHKFMCGRQLSRLAAFTNLKHLRFVGRFLPPKDGRPAHPPLRLFRNLMLLGKTLPGLEKITIVSHMYRSYNVRYSIGRFATVRELEKWGWGYVVRFNAANRIVVEDHTVEVLWRMGEGQGLLGSQVS